MIYASFYIGLVLVIAVLGVYHIDRRTWGDKDHE